MALNARQQEFVNQYLSTFNATQAAIAAGYSEKTAHSIGWENLRKPEIAEAIKKRLNATAMTADEVLMRLADYARGDMRDFLTDSGDIDLISAIADGKARLLKKITQKRTRRIFEQFDVEETVTSIELYDALAANKMLGDHHALFKGTSENPQHIVTHTHDEWVADQEKRRQEATDALTDFVDE